MHYYALSDTFAGDDPREYTAGFANTKVAIAFRSKEERTDWLRTTRLLTARAISRKEAEDSTKWEPSEYYTFFSGGRVKPVRLYHSGDYVILRKQGIY